MPTINTVDYSAMGLQTYAGPTREVKKELGQSDFLALLSAQLANQDPLAPVDNKEFISQMSQFASVDSLQSLVTKFDSLSSSLTSNQALQASALVGRNVLVPGSQAYKGPDGMIAGQLNLDTTAVDVHFEIRDASGQTLRRVAIGTQQPGDMDFIWDGKNDAGEVMPAGLYTVAAFGRVGGLTQQLPTSMISRVESVSLGNADGNIWVNLAGLGQISFNEIKEIG